MAAPNTVTLRQGEAITNDVRLYTVPDLILSSSLISFWELEETSGTRYDSVDANRNDLTDNNTVLSVAGKVNTAAQLVLASSESLSHVSNASLQTGDIDQTVCAWVYLDTKPVGSMRIASKTDATTGAGWGLEWKPTDVFSFRLWQAGGASALDAPATAFGAPSLATWYFVVGRFNATTGIGTTSVNAGTFTATAKAGTPASDAVGFAIGASADGTSFFNGRIDQVGLWKRRLTDIEVTYLYNGGNGRTFAEINDACLAGGNTIALSAPDVPSLALTMPVDTNLITLSAPAQSQSMTVTLAAGSNTITLSAPTAPSLALTMPVLTNTITLTAPAQSQAVTVTLDAGSNTVTLTAPAQSQVVEITLAAGSNTVTLTAPTVPAVNLTMPISTNTITLSAPAQSQTVEITLPSGSNTITLTAPAQSQSITVTLTATTNLITLSAPAPNLAFDQVLIATNNVDTISAPTATLLVGVQFYGNFTAHSEELDDTATWSPYQSHINANVIAAPDATMTADKIASDGFDFGEVFVDSAVITPADTDVVFSIYLKAAEITTVIIDFYSFTLHDPYVVGEYDLLAGTATARIDQSGWGLADNNGPITVGIEDVGGGWFRCWIGTSFTGLGITEAGLYLDYFSLATPALDDGFYAWGAQTEVGSRPYSYIKTTTDPIPVTIFTFAAAELTYSAPTANLAIDQIIVATNNSLATTAPDAALLVGVEYDGDDITFTFAAPVTTLEAPEALGIVDGGESIIEVTTNTVILSAPAQSQLVATALSAGQNTVVITAPSSSVIADQFITAVANTVTTTAPVASTVDAGAVLLAAPQVLVITAPTITFQPQYFGVLKVRDEARITLLRAQTSLIGATATSIEAPVAVLKAQTAPVPLSMPLRAKLGLVVSSSDIMVG